jgi:peptide/nickel transport system ATP-binding protein
MTLSQRHAALRLTPTSTEPLLVVEDLRTDIRLRRSTVHAVDGVSFSLQAGETLGLVGESGCGKTMTALSLMGLLPHGGEVVGGSIRLEGRELVGAGEATMRSLRGNAMGMVFQDPLTSLNPTMTVGAQISEAIRLHRDVTHDEALRRTVEVLERVGIPRAASRVRNYPHQFSGGMRQRAMIAMALACSPRLLIADEPTTALDVTIQAQILELIDDLRRDLGMAVILVTHDLGVIAGQADRVAVMYAGRLVEVAPTEELYARPRHRYTEALFSALPERAVETRDRLYTIPGTPPDLTDPPRGCRFAARCQFAEGDCRRTDPALLEVARGHHVACFHQVGVEGHLEVGERIPEPVGLNRDTEVLLELDGIVKDFPLSGGAFSRVRGQISAVAGVSLSVRHGQTLGIVGESGCGKTTTGRIAVGLDQPTAGVVRIDGDDVSAVRRGRRRELRNQVQFMFQDPYASLDPRMRVGAILREPLQIQRRGNRVSQRRRIAELMDGVGLPRSALDRYPHEFSGGQRQRIGLARALALSPRLIVADEPVSALDVSVQAQILNTMRLLQRELGLTYVVISHDLSVIRYLADTIGVMYLGKLVEEGPSEDVHLHPMHPYTHGLIQTIPVADPQRGRRKRAEVSGELPSAVDPPSGCRFRTRCPLAQPICAEQEPPLRFLRPGHRVACHFPLETAGQSPLGPVSLGGLRPGPGGGSSTVPPA